MFANKPYVTDKVHVCIHVCMLLIPFKLINIQIKQANKILRIIGPGNRLQIGCHNSRDL